MNLFADYIQPITFWLQTHPYLALLVAFFVSFLESLAIVGSVVPGSVTMTALGILAGSGIMRIDLTLIAATLGATAGDSFSYLLGYTYSDKLNTLWPFRRYPQWLTYGKEFFSRHGGKSVLIGRFVGPLRSIIPVIAGMMHMRQWRFFSANIISAIGWSCLYVLPGVLIGAASNELSAESATRLFALILVFLGGLWLFGVIIKWLLIRFHLFLRAQLGDFCVWSSKHKILAQWLYQLASPGEKSPLSTITLCLSLIISSLCLLVITYLALSTSWINTINVPSYFFLQSLRIYPFDVFFIVLTHLISYLNLVCFMGLCCLIMLYKRDWRTLNYWLSLNISCIAVLFLMHWLINSPRPDGLYDTSIIANSYPAIHLTVATTYCLAWLCFLKTYAPSSFTAFLAIALPILLLLQGIALTYLGDNWVIDSLGAYACGSSLVLIHWLFYRRQSNKKSYSSTLIPLLLASWLATTALSLALNYTTSMRAHTPSLVQYVLTKTSWWMQDKPILPIYRTNRIGKQVSFFNIQYTGNLDHLEKLLINHGWRTYHQSFLMSLIKRINGQQTTSDMPLMAPLYLNHEPALIMTYTPNDGTPALMLQLWHSNYYLEHLRHPIWLGTIYRQSLPTYLLSDVNRLQSLQQMNTSLHYFTDALSNFTTRKIPLKVMLPSNAPYLIAPTLLLIKEQ